MLLHHCALASCLAAFAGNRSDAEGSHRPAPAPRPGLQRSAMHRVSETIGKLVQSAHGAQLGEVTELILDEHGATVYAVLSIDRSVGGNRLYPVPWRELRPSAGAETLVLDVSLELLCKAPSFHKSDWPDMTDAAWGVTVQRYYALTVGAEATRPAPLVAPAAPQSTEAPASRPGQRTVRGIVVGIERLPAEESGGPSSRLKIKAPDGIVVVQLGPFPLAFGEGTRVELDEVLEVTGVMARTPAGSLLIARELRTEREHTAALAPR